MSIQVVQTISAAQSILSAWHRLPNLHPFQTPEWCLNWFEHFGGRGQLAIICDWVDGDELSGLAPLYWEPSVGGPRLKFLGSGIACSDYTAILTTGHHRRPTLANIAGEIDRLLKQKSRWLPCRLQLEGIEAGSVWFDEFRCQMKNRRFSIDQYPLQASYKVELPQDWKAFTTILGKSFRRKAKKLHQRLENGQVQFHRATDRQQIESRFETLVNLHQKRRNSIGEPGSFADPRFAPFLKSAAIELAARGQAELQWIETAGNTMAMQLCFVHSKTMSMYVTGMDCDYLDQEPGFTAVAASINNAIERGFTCYDFLRGDERYKQNWKAQPSALVRAHLTPPRWLPQVAESVYCQTVGIRRKLRRFAQAVNLHPTR